MTLTDGSEVRGDCRSSRSWVIGEGHVDLHEARLRSVQEIEDLEAELDERRRELLAADEAFRAALSAKQQAVDAVDRIEGRLRVERRIALYRLSSSSDVSRPPDLRGPEHDLDDTLLDGPVS